jgi:D-alanine--poly(phosphoribitol) ligase subunit 1
VPIHLFVDDELPPLPAAAAPPPFFRDAVAYIIFTSGSTGRPKGVQITQANLVAFLNAFGARYGRGRGYRYLSLGPLFFDMTVLDCFVPLAYGASTYLYNQPYLPGLFASVVERHRINCFSAVPSVLSRLITHESAPRLAPRFGSLKLLLLGAEPFGAPLVKLLLDTVPGLHIINAYGPTEGSVCCFSYELDSTRAAGMEEYPVGYPFEGVRWQLKTADGAWTTRGTGTLYVGGDQVMRGYASRPAETAARIVTLDGVRYYNTGDVIEIDDRGRAIFRGREDDEVKLSGFRVHLLDVVRNLEEFPQLESPVAMKVTIGGDECLAVAFAAAPDVDVESVPRRLKAELPLYMIPRVWIACVEIPRLPNGKVDRTAVKGMIEQTIAGMDAPTSGGKALIVRQERGPIDVGGRAMTAAATPN